MVFYPYSVMGQQPGDWFRNQLRNYQSSLQPPLLFPPSSVQRSFPPSGPTYPTEVITSAPSSGPQPIPVLRPIRNVGRRPFTRVRCLGEGGQKWCYLRTDPSEIRQSFEQDRYLPIGTDAAVIAIGTGPASIRIGAPRIRFYQIRTTDGRTGWLPSTVVQGMV